MKRLSTAAACAALLTCFCAAPLLADHHESGEMADMPAMSDEEKAMMGAWMASMTPGEQHADLAKSAGTWSMKVEMWMDPAAEPQVSQAKAERTMILGDRVLEERVTGTMMGNMPFEGIGHTGYDNVTKKWWSNWMDTFGTGVSTSTGEWDEAENAAVFTGTTTDPMKGSKAIKSIVRHMGEDQEVFEMYEDRDGTEVMTMRVTYTR